MGREHHARRVFEGVKRAFVTDPAKRRMTEAIPIVDDALAYRIIDLAMRIGAAMLSIGASAREVAQATLRITRAFGLKKAHVDVTFTSITVSDHRDGAGQPVTLMQVVQSIGADHQKLQRLQALVDQIERGMELHDAVTEFHRIRRIPFMYREAIVVLVSSLLAVAVALMFHAGWVVLLSAGFAALVVAAAQMGLGRARVPVFFSQIVGGIVLTAVTALIAWLGRMGVEPFVDVRANLVVAAGIVLMLAGVAVVGAAQDAIDGFSLTATGRILDLTIMTMGLVVGILVGLQVAESLGVGIPVPSDAVTMGPWVFQLVGAFVIASAVAIINGGGPRIIGVSTVLGALAWMGSFAFERLVDLPTAAGAFGGALLASLVGSVLAVKLHVPSVAVTTAAIIPIVPGAALFRALLGIVQSGSEADHLLIAFGGLLDVIMIGIALAAGATLGIFLGAPLRVRLSDRKVRFLPAARPTSGAGTAPLEIVPAEPREIPTEPLPDPVAEPAGAEEPPITRPFDVSDLRDER
ncbi:MAG: threonine/serine ThrE exporter family protein [Microbacterium sp.]